MMTQLHACSPCAGPLSEIGEVRDATEDTHSIYGDSDLMSSDGRDQARSCNKTFLALPERPSRGLLSSIPSSLTHDHDMLQAKRLPQ